MPYTITIRETRTVTKTVGKEWKVVGQEEWEREQNILHAAMLGEHNGNVTVDLKPKDVYGYTPEIERQVEVETKLLEQTVETLDLPAVIKAINNLT